MAIMFLVDDIAVLQLYGTWVPDFHDAHESSVVWRRLSADPAIQSAVSSTSIIVA